MTTTQPKGMPRTRAAGLWATAAGTGILLAAVDLTSTPGYPWIALAVFTAAAVAIAVVDVRTKLLPNRYTGPLALAAALQVIAVSISTHNAGIALQAVPAAAIVLVAYTIMAMIGWFGFGDAKFAGALTLFTAIWAGWLAIYLIPIAVLISGGERAVRMLSGRGRSAHAHGPSIAAAGTLLAFASIIL